MSNQVFTITQVNEYIRKMMDCDGMLTSLAVKGEISNYKVYPSGHHYFTLKDDGSTLKCVMFRSNSLRLKFRPENGMKIIAMGKISVYPRDGVYQLYCSSLVLDGLGDLHIAFEQTKAKLAAQGLFDDAHKKPLPSLPNTIGIVTSEAGAAVHDMLRILKKRFPLTRVLLLPVRVQGADAPGEIAAAIRYANHYKLADLLIVGRGGGSIEDLWAFNEEIVAYAIYQSEIPVISAVGHEPDVTISDYVADLRAATPSNAAELAVPDSDNIRQHLDSMSATIHASLLKQLKTTRQRLNILQSNPALTSPTKYIALRRDALMYLSARLKSALEKNISAKKQNYISLTAKLDAMSPLKVLSRGYALVYTDTGDLLRSTKQVQPSDVLEIHLHDGNLQAVIEKISEDQ